MVYCTFCDIEDWKVGSLWEIFSCWVNVDDQFTNQMMSSKLGLIFSYIIVCVFSISLSCQYCSNHFVLPNLQVTVGVFHGLSQVPPECLVTFVCAKMSVCRCASLRCYGVFKSIENLSNMPSYRSRLWNAKLCKKIPLLLSTPCLKFFQSFLSLS